MKSRITFLPVGNGDMTLISLADTNNSTIVVDCNIRAAADDPSDPTRDVAADLRKRLKRDPKGRPYVDAFLMSRPDQDHCGGLREHFYLGPPENYPDDKKPDDDKRILICEMWSSPVVFRRASKDHVLCDDAAAFATEARRRVSLHRTRRFTGIEAGNRIVVLGEDIDGKTDDLAPILVKVGQYFSRINGTNSECFQGTLRAPLSEADDVSEDELTKNNSSVVMQMKLWNDSTKSGVCVFLTGGDAEVAIWEALWRRHKFNRANLAYHLLLAPHHCSWHSLSYDSWSDLHEDAEVSVDARSALSQIEPNGVIVASSKPIHDDDNDPPCYGAMQVYRSIAGSASGQFICTSEHPSAESPLPMEFEVTTRGVTLLAPTSSPSSGRSLLRPAAAAATGLATFPNRPIVPNKPAGFA